MNKLVIAAAALSLATFLLHVFGGGPEIHEPLLAGAPSAVLGAFVSVLWHFVTVILLINSGALGLAAVRPDWRKPLVVLVSGQCFAAAVLFLVYGWTRLESLVAMPQWLLLAGIGALAVAGLKGAGDIRVAPAGLS